MEIEKKITTFAETSISMKNIFLIITLCCLFNIKVCWNQARKFKLCSLLNLLNSTFVIASFNGLLVFITQFFWLSLNGKSTSTIFLLYSNLELKSILFLRILFLILLDNYNYFLLVLDV